MSTQSVSSFAPSSSSSWKYDVFLSFRGEDIRQNFLGHLYHALKNKGLEVFKDDIELKAGDVIAPGLFQAIEESRFLVIIFSKNYASSSWCLKELHKIVECNKNTREQVIYPIFYDVEPTAVRNQIGNYGEAFAKHEASGKNRELVPKWRDALKEVADISGKELKNRLEIEFIQEIAEDLLRRSGPRTSGILGNLVGLDSRLEKLKSLIDTRDDDVRMIGIYGMGGLGKTTIARVVFELISYEFEGRSFLQNVREISEKDGLFALQNQLLRETLKEPNIKIYNEEDGIQMIRSRLRTKKVFVVIDDVVHINQLNKLVGERSWFGLGSRIIITTRDKHLLTTHRVDHVYKAEALNDDDALQLLNSKVFNNNQPLVDYMELINRVVKYASGLPLALNVLGSFLVGRNIDEWRSALERLNRDSENEILDILEISFHGLKEIEKKIFLDVACFFQGMDKDYVTNLLDACGFDPIIGVRVLIEKSLITVLHNNKLWMHDLLQEMGQQIVKRKSLEEPGKRSRIWMGADLRHVLENNSGTEDVEAIIVDGTKESGISSSADAKAFSKMTNLRFLKVLNVQLPEGLEYLSNELRLLEWGRYPLKSLPPNLQLEKTVALDIWHSSIEQLWVGIKPLSRLKFMRLDHSQNLIRTPDFTEVPNLEKLILEGCISLYEIHPSLLVHKKLTLLNLKGCTSIITLPNKIAMESLRQLVLSGCTKLMNFPEILGSMQCLSELLLNGTAIEELPLSIKLLTGLVLLDLNGCNNLARLPSTVHSLKSLKTLKLSSCPKLKNISENLGQVESLEEFDGSEILMTPPHWFIFRMRNLKALSLRGCRFLIGLRLPSFSALCSLIKLDLSGCNLGEGAIPSDIGNLISLEELYLSGNNFVSLPASLSRLFKLKQIELEDCKWLEYLPELPSTVEVANINGCTSLKTISNAFILCQARNIIVNCINCSKLLTPIYFATTIMQQWYLSLQEESIPRTKFSIVVPGNQIPQWFHSQSQSSAVTIRRPRDYNEDNKQLVGYIVCYTFLVNKHRPATRKIENRTHHLSSHIQLDGRYTRPSHKIGFNVKFGEEVSEHLWLLYFSRQHIDDEEFPGEPKYDNVTFYYMNWASPGLRVTGCGIHPLYD